VGPTGEGTAQDPVSESVPIKDKTHTEPQPSVKKANAMRGGVVGKIDEPELHLRTEEDGPQQSKTPMSTLKVQMPETAKDITDLRLEQKKGQGSYVRLGRGKDPTVDLPPAGPKGSQS
jgi:hypothetical protein